MAVKGKWAQGIRPRNFHWIIKDQIAVCERPGGYGQNHRRVRRQEEIIWIREQEFSAVVSLIRDTEKRRQIETAARRLVVDHYDWSAVANDFESALSNARGQEPVRLTA